jgi:nitrogen-specific signal transduction histidine kinase
LGLAIAQHIVVQHNGRLEIKSAPETGTVVEVSLPAEEPLPPGKDRFGAEAVIAAEQLLHQGK